MHTTVKVEDGAGRDAARISEQLVAADESLRKSFAGLPVDDVVLEVERSLVEIGVEVPADQVRDWAQHIADRADHELVLH